MRRTRKANSIKEAGQEVENGGRRGFVPWLRPFLAVLWIASLVSAGFLVLSNRGSEVVRASVILASGLIGLLTGGVFVAHAPKVRARRIREKQFHAFYKAISQATKTLQLQEILDSAAKIIVDVAGVRGCSIKLLEAQSGRMAARSLAGIDAEKTESALEIAESIYHKGLMEGEPVVVRDTYLRDFPAVNEQVESMVCVPLRIEDRILGAVCVFGQRGQKLSREIISLLSVLGDVVSLAIAHALRYENLKDVVDTKTNFMLTASHELRSPLDTLQSMARTLLDGYLGDMNKKQKEMIGRMGLRAGKLAEIVSDLLTLAVGRVELSTLKPSRFDLCRLLREGSRLFETQAQEKGIDLHLHLLIEEAPVIGHPEGIRSVVANLLANAIKYTPAGGEVALKIFSKKDKIILEVKDTGIGIPKKEQDKLFTEFFRASNAKALTEAGTGLGLVIVKAKVEQHGGSIEWESEEGDGTTLRVSLNRAENAETGGPRLGHQSGRALEVRQ
jgi:signal transduction histidine kinase